MSRPRCVYCGVRTASVLTWRSSGIVTCRPCSDLVALDPNHGLALRSPAMPLEASEAAPAAREKVA